MSDPSKTTKPATTHRFRPDMEQLEARETPAAIALPDFYQLRGGRLLVQTAPDRNGQAGILRNDFDDSLTPNSNRGLRIVQATTPIDQLTGLPIGTPFTIFTNGGFTLRAPHNFNGVIQFNYRAATASGLLSAVTPVSIAVSSPIRRVAIGADQGSAPAVAVFDATTKSSLFTFNAFDGNFKGGVRVATGDFNRDGTDDIVCAAGPGAGPHVKIFDGRNGSQIASFFAFDAGFKGGLEVATGDLDGDDIDDLIVSAGSGPNAHVKVFDGFNVAAAGFNPNSASNVLASFFAYGTGETNGVRVAAGEFDGDNTIKLVTAPSSGSTQVKTFDLSGGGAVQERAFFAGDPTDRRGLFVTAGDFNGDFFDDIAVGSGSGRPEARIYGRGAVDNTFVLQRSVAAASYVDGFVSDSFTTPFTTPTVTNPGPNYLEGALASPAVVPTNLIGSPNTTRPGSLQGYTGGMRVAVDYLNRDNFADLVLAQGPNGFPRVQFLSGQDLSTLADFTVFNGFFGGLNVAGHF